MKEGTSKNPLVYIIMPCYNAEKYLLEQLMSIYHQNYKNWYLIFVNDGSIDSSEQIIRNWISHYDLYEKVKVITKENGGVNSAVQRGLEEVKNMSNGVVSNNFVSYCDADDIWTREKLNLQVKYMVDHPECGLSFHDSSIIDENGKLTNAEQSKTQYLKNLSFLYVSVLGISPASNRVMFKEKYIDDILPIPFNLPAKYQAQDEWTFLVLSLLEVDIHHIKELLTYHRLGHQSLGAQVKKTSKEEYRSNKKKIYCFLQDRFPEKDLTYIINFKDDFFKWEKYGYIYQFILIIFKHPRIAIVLIDYILFKIKIGLVG